MDYAVRIVCYFVVLYRSGCPVYVFERCEVLFGCLPFVEFHICFFFFPCVSLCVCLCSDVPFVSVQLHVSIVVPYHVVVFLWFFTETENTISLANC